MGKKKQRKGRREAERLGGAAALGAFLSQPIVKDLVVKAVVAGVTAMAGRLKEKRTDAAPRSRKSP